MFRPLIYFLFPLFFLFFISSCKNENKKIIPRDKFKEVLIDLARADGILEINKQNDKDLKNDSLSYYSSIYKKYDITREQFNESMKYYSSSIADFDKMVEEIGKQFLEEKEDASLDADMSEGAVQVKDSNDIWNQRPFFSMPDDGRDNPIQYNIPAKFRGTYTLSADIKVYPDDGTIKLRMSLEMHYEDGNQASNVNQSMVKDGQWHHYELSFTTYKEGANLKYLEGAVLNYTKVETEMHIEIKNIKMIYTKAL